MTLHLFAIAAVAAIVIAAACYLLRLVLQESDADRARGYAAGSPERRMLEGL